MNTLRVDLGDRSYDIVIAAGILDGLGEQMKGLGLGKKAALVSNPSVFALYGGQVLRSLEKAGFDAFPVLIPDGEEYKDMNRIMGIMDELLQKGMDRKCSLIALGGGVVGDMAGFAAAIYMRGIAYIQVPTTLLAQVDSSVGGKTGVNHPSGKNMIGAFYQPRLVYADTDTLKTLPRRELLAGLSEVIKYGVIWDGEFFTFLETNKDALLTLDATVLAHAITRSCQIKAEVVSQDERESGVRAILNYGHTIGHALETITGYRRYLHGEAVAIGMHIEARLAQVLSLLARPQVHAIETILSDYGLPARIPADVDKEALIQAMALDKKTVAGDVKFVLPVQVGKVVLRGAITREALEEALYSEATP